MTDRKFDVMAIEHGHVLLFRERHRITLPSLTWSQTTMKDRLAVRRLDQQFRLEQPGDIPTGFRFALPIHQKEGHRPEVGAFPDDPLHFDVGHLRIRYPGRHFAVTGVLSA